MRLINAKTRVLQEFFDSATPPYAILSHTWGHGEILFHDINANPGAWDDSKYQSLHGLRKIQETCRLALEHGLEWAWVDTCCIDKSSSAELTEAINSMFRWYQNADVCIVFLSDLDDLPDLPHCRWFTRGWTLQELLAPARMEFFNHSWAAVGSKESLLSQLSTITGIREAVLTGDIALEDLAVAEKMSWAAHRATTRSEDVAYCLFGVFGVNMPLLYGESSNAFRRLQEEIIRRGNDLTIFAWDHSADSPWKHSIFSSSPRDYAVYHDKFPNLTHMESHDLGVRGVRPEYTLTNSGLRLYARLEVVWYLNDANGQDIYLLKLGTVTSADHDVTIAITLVKIGAGLFLRSGPLLEIIDDQHGASVYHRTTATDPHVITIAVADSHSMTRARIRNLEWSVEISSKDSGVKYVAYAVPESLWDRTTRSFFCPHSKFHVSAALVDAHVNDGRGVTLLVIIDRRAGPFARLVDWSTDGAKWKAFLFRESRESLTWDDLRYQIGDSVDSLAQSVILKPPAYDPTRPALQATASLVQRDISLDKFPPGAQLLPDLLPRYELVLDIQVAQQNENDKPREVTMSSIAKLMLPKRPSQTQSGLRKLSPSRIPDATMPPRWPTE